jgi:hypothetical protein
MSAPEPPDPRMERRPYPHDFLMERPAEAVRIRCGSPFQILGRLSLHAPKGTVLQRGVKISCSAIFQAGHIRTFTWLGPDTEVPEVGGITTWVLAMHSVEGSFNSGYQWHPHPSPMDALLPFTFLPDCRELEPQFGLVEPRQATVFV